MKYRYTFLCALIVLALSARPLNAQNAKLDSLLRLEPTAGRDTAAVWLYEAIGDIYVQSGDNETARRYYQRMKKLSDELNFVNGKIKFASAYTNMLIQTGEYDSIVLTNMEALRLANDIGNPYYQAAAQLNIGNGYNLKGCLETALTYYFKALAAYEAVGDSASMGHTYDMLQTVYWDLDDYEHALEYGRKSERLLRNDTDPYFYTVCLLNLANTTSDLKMFDETIDILDRALKLAQEHKYAYLESTVYVNKCEILRLAGYFDYKDLALKALTKAKEVDDPESIALAHVNLGYVLFYENSFDKAKESIQMGLKIAEENDFKYIVSDAFKLLSDLYFAQHEYKDAVKFENISDSVHNLLVNNHIRLASEELEVRYETEKRELQISALEEEQRLMRRSSIMAGLTMLLTIAVLFFLWQLTQKRRRLAELKVQQLEQEKQLIATQAVLDGETAERTRLRPPRRPRWFAQFC